MFYVFRPEHDVFCPAKPNHPGGAARTGWRGIYNLLKARGRGGIPGSPARGRSQDFEFSGLLPKKSKKEKKQSPDCPFHMLSGMQPNTYQSNIYTNFISCQFPWQLRPYIRILIHHLPRCAADRLARPHLAAVALPVGSGKCGALKPPQPARNKCRLPGLFLIQSKSATLPARIKWKGVRMHARFAPQAYILAACAAL